MNEKENYFAELNAVDVSGKVEKKNGLSYLSWTYAWAELKKKHPDATYTIYHNKDGWNYHTDGRTCWVQTGVTVNGIEHVEELPIMDLRNRSIPTDAVTSCDVNKTIQRSLTKAIARHGLGLYVYAGEDLPEDQKQATDARMGDKQDEKKPKTIKCERCGKKIEAVKTKDGRTMSAEQITVYSAMNFGQRLCAECQREEKEKRKEKSE